VRLDDIGDGVMLGPALRAVKETSPGAKITLLATPGGASAAPLLPWVDDVIVWWPVWQDLGHLPFDPARELELVRMLAERSFDAALIFTSFSQTPHVPGYVCYVAGIPLRAGESTEFGGACLDIAPEEVVEAAGALLPHAKCEMQSSGGRSTPGATAWSTPGPWPGSRSMAPRRCASFPSSRCWRHV
jgi:ADP-heptose:LPS heptosyltransferase